MIVPNKYTVTKENEDSGIVNIRQILVSEDKFYEALEKIINIKDFKLIPSEPKTHNCIIQGKTIDLNYLFHWGNYHREDFEKNENSDIDLLGWGTKSIIIIYYRLFFNKTVVFIEEPEISTHPRLLQNLFDWVNKNKKDKDTGKYKWQFFITTHSNLLLDKLFTKFKSKELTIFRVFKENNKTNLELINKTKDKILLLENLGYKSSNLLFNNYLIWVEGPSDIFYYEAFLNMAGYLSNKRIKRGEHYDIMWYGGREEVHLFDLESTGDIEKIFSFSRKGAVFWDCDSLKLSENRKEIIKKVKNMNGRFCVGCTGEILSGDSYKYPLESHPLTIENIMSENIAKKALDAAFLGKENTARIARKIGNNQKIEKKDNVVKIELARKFYDIIDSMIGSNKEDRKEAIKKIFEYDKFYYNDENGKILLIKYFFEDLYKRILKANDI